MYTVFDPIERMRLLLEPRIEYDSLINKLKSDRMDAEILLEQGFVTRVTDFSKSVKAADKALDDTKTSDAFQSIVKQILTGTASESLRRELVDMISKHPDIIHTLTPAVKKAIVAIVPSIAPTSALLPAALDRIHATVAKELNLDKGKMLSNPIGLSYPGNRVIMSDMYEMIVSGPTFDDFSFAMKPPLPIYVGKNISPTLRMLNVSRDRNPVSITYYKDAKLTANESYIYDMVTNLVSVLASTSDAIFGHNYYKALVNVSGKAKPDPSWPRTPDEIMAEFRRLKLSGKGADYANTVAPAHAHLLNKFAIGYPNRKNPAVARELRSIAQQSYHLNVISYDRLAALTRD